MIHPPGKPENEIVDIRYAIDNTTPLSILRRVYVNANHVARTVWEAVVGYLFDRNGFALMDKNGVILKGKNQ